MNNKITINDVLLFDIVIKNYNVKKLINRYLPIKKTNILIKNIIKKQLNFGILKNEDYYSKVINDYLEYKIKIPNIKNNITWINNIYLHSNISNETLSTYIIYIHSDFIECIIYYLLIYNYHARNKKINIMNTYLSYLSNKKNINIHNDLLNVIFSFI